MLQAGRGAPEVWFTGTEPTTDPHLDDYVRSCRELGYRGRGVVTNGRRLAYPRYADRLVSAGVTHLSISVHGHTAPLHEMLTRTPGSFDQTVEGLRVASRLRPLGLTLRTSTVVTRHNLPFLPAIYHVLGGLGVDEVTFRALRPQGRGAGSHAALAVPWRALAVAFRALVEEASESQPATRLLGLPACVTNGIVDRHVALAGGFDPCQGSGGEASRRKRDECAACVREPACDGVWDDYLAAFGWDEFVPVVAGQGP
jgi:cyclic pyranopterin phosphate synthase